MSCCGEIEKEVSVKVLQGRLISLDKTEKKNVNC
jgi:hypothetical protein